MVRGRAVWWSWALLATTFESIPGGATAAGPAERGSLLREVLVDLCDGARLASELRDAAMEETSRIYREHGVAIVWSLQCDEPPSRAPSTARVYVLDELPGSIRYRFLHDHNKSLVMGYSLPTEERRAGSVLYVATGPIGTELGETSANEEALSRALGRVIAHELAHRFLQSGHTESGILKDTFGRADLVGDGAALQLDEAQVRVLHAVARKREESPTERIARAR